MYVANFGYNSPPVVAINTDYAFIRLVDKPNGKDWNWTDKDFCRHTPATSKVVQGSRADLAMNNASTAEMKIRYHIGCM